MRSFSRLMFILSAALAVSALAAEGRCEEPLATERGYRLRLQAIEVDNSKIENLGIAIPTSDMSLEVLNALAKNKLCRTIGHHEVAITLNEEVAIDTAGLVARANTKADAESIWVKIDLQWKRAKKDSAGDSPTPHVATTVKLRPNQSTCISEFREDRQGPNGKPGTVTVLFFVSILR